MDTVPPKSLHFDDFVVDLMRCALLRDGEALRLRPKAFEVLCHLALHAGRVVTKRELFQAVWPDLSVTDDTLVQCVRDIRQALGDEARRIIQTLPRRGYLLAVEVTRDDAGAVARTAAVQAAAHPSIAVQPFRTFSKRGQFMAAGLVEELTEQLDRHRCLDVRWCGPDAPNVRYLVQGSVRGLDAPLRVSARLIDTKGHLAIWTGHFEAESADVSTQADVARLIAAQSVTELERCLDGAAGAGPVFSSPWEAYRYGTRELFRFRADAIERAIDCFEQAIALDPGYAPAQARLAYAQLQLGWYGNQVRRSEWLRLAAATAHRALALDPRQALAHLALGRALVLLERPADGLNALSAAVEANPSLPQALFAIGQALTYRDRPVDGLKHLLEAARLGPYDPHLWTFLHAAALAHARMGALDEAEAYARRAVVQPNATHWAFATLVMVLGLRGKTGEAEPYVDELVTRVPGYSVSFADHDWGGCATRDLKRGYLAGLRAAGMPLS
jgi:DNA-binding winged helix-turn-helix (wHTH) protein/Tfp pilus assembly protein PilF